MNPDSNKDQRSKKTQELEQFLMLHGNKSVKSVGIITQAKNLNAAAGRILKAAAMGQMIRVQKDELQYRLSVCRSCDLWDEGGNIGLGKCNHSGCGCTRLKHGFATEKCPLGKWKYKRETSNPL